MSDIKVSAFADEHSVSLEAQINALKNNGLEYIELRFIDGKNVSVLSLEEATEVKRSLDSAGIKVSAIGSPLGKIKLSDDFTEHLDLTRHVCRLAKLFGTKYIRMFSFYPTEGKHTEESFGEVLEKLEKMLAVAKEEGVMLCHENEEGIAGEAPEACLRLMKHFCGELGCVFDMGNFLLGGYDPMKAYEMLRNYITYFHIKDALGAGAIVPAGLGEAKIKEILARYKNEVREDFIISIEPHLETFDGLNALVKEGVKFENPYKFESKESAFDFAVGETKKLI